MKAAVVGVFLASLSLGLGAQAATPPSAWLVRRLVQDGKTRIVGVEPRYSVPSEREQILNSLPEGLDEGPLSTKALYEEVLYRHDALPEALRTQATESLQSKPKADWPGSEVRTLVLQGEPKNRINLTIVGDGYTAKEKEKFFDDARRITNDLFGESTFESYTPLFNVFAVFVPSRDSGITDTVQRQTALGLYRNPPESKRAIMPGDSPAIERALALAPVRADYPILLANDDYYGGLGGRYAITTRSIESGPVVLRHELGHNFGSVGEEYDGGYVYSGANNSSGTGSSLKWKQWADAKSKVNEVKFLAGEYLWKNLSEGPIRVPFRFPAAGPAGEYRFQVSISSVGWATPDDVRVHLDNKSYGLVGHFTKDRSFFDLAQSPQLTGGNHAIEFSENVADGDNVLAFAMVYAHAADYDFTQDQIGAYPVYDDGMSLSGYRPTHDSCLMRNMLTKKFCAPDLENMWLRFLARVTLIDSVEVSAQKVAVKTPPLKGLEIQWFRVNGAGAEVEVADLKGKAEWTPGAGDKGRYRVHVRFSTQEIRLASDRLEADRTFNL